MKTCGRCHVAKPLDEFQNARKELDGKQWWCRECMHAATKARYESKRIGERARGLVYYRAHKEERETYRIKKRYGLTPEQRETMRASQGGKCAIGKCLETHLFIDHDHVTGRARGLLCRYHNLGLGYIERDPTFADAAAAYLARAAA